MNGDESVKAVFSTGPVKGSVEVTGELGERDWQHICLTFNLSEQQTRIARLVVEDQSNKEIARILKIAESTVQTHLTRLEARVGSANRHNLVAKIYGCVLARERELRMRETARH